MTLVLLLIFVLAMLVIYRGQRAGVSLGKLVMWGTFLGIGVLIQILSGFPDKPMEITYIKEAILWYSLIGGGFIDLIRMLILPIVFVSIVNVILNMRRDTDLRKLATSTVSVAMIMVSIAALVGMFLGIFFNLGAGHNLLIGDNSIRKIQPVVETLRHLIPAKPVTAMAEINVITLVVFAVFIGFIVKLIKNKGG